MTHADRCTILVGERPWILHMAWSLQISDKLSHMANSQVEILRQLIGQWIRFKLASRCHRFSASLRPSLPRTLAQREYLNIILYN